MLLYFDRICLFHVIEKNVVAFDVRLNHHVYDVEKTQGRFIDATKHPVNDP